MCDMLYHYDCAVLILLMLLLLLLSGVGLALSGNRFARSAALRLGGLLLFLEKVGGRSWRKKRRLSQK